MLSEQELRFIDYWEQNRLKKKKFLKQLYLGLPLAVVIVSTILINFFSGWDKRAQTIIQKEPSIILVILVAAMIILVFITIFSIRHKWDMNEQYYRELISKKERES
jgi:hypothetical protein